MEWADVLRRIEAGEGRTTEFKREVGNDHSAIGKAICAFANTAGGLIVLGVDDAGNVAGLIPDPITMHERLTGFLQTGCSAPVAARCGRHEVANGWVHWCPASEGRNRSAMAGAPTSVESEAAWSRRPRSFRSCSTPSASS